MPRSAFASRFLAILSLLFVAVVPRARAEIPPQIHYQGRVVVDGINFNGTGQFKFLLYEHTDSDAVPPAQVDLPLWSNASSAPADLSAPTTAVSVPVVHGHYAVGLGDTALANMAALPASLLPTLPHDQVFLRVWFNDGSGFEQLTPDQPVRTVPFALHAQRAESVPDGSIGTLALAPGAVTAANLEPGAVSQLGNPSGTIPDALQIDALGHAGVGTGSPQAALHVTGGAMVTAPRLLSKVPASPYGQDFACTEGGLLAAADTLAGTVALWDISDPDNPILRVTLRNEEVLNSHYLDTIPGPSLIAFDPSGHLLVIASTDGSGSDFRLKWITLIAVESPADPNPTYRSWLVDGTDGFDAIGDVEALALSETESGVFLAAASFSSNSTLSIINVTDPASPQLESVLVDDDDGFEFLGSVYGMDFEGPVLALASYSEHAVSLVDVTQPDTPELRAVFQRTLETGGHIYANLSYPTEVEIAGNLLAIASNGDLGAGGSPSLTLVDIENPSEPQLQTILYPEDFPFISVSLSIALSNEGLLVVGGPGPNWPTVSLLDTTEAHNPVLLQQISGQGEFGALELPAVKLHASRLLIRTAVDGSLLIVDPFVAVPNAAGIVVENRVGIGVAAPEATLHVGGDVRIDKAQHFDVQAEKTSLGGGNTIQNQGIALGYLNLVENSGITVGTGNTATGVASLAMGTSAEARGHFSVALGDNAETAGESATAIGEMAKANGAGGVALGTRAESSGVHANALASDSHASGDRSATLGTGTLAPSYAETALGAYNTEPPTVHSEDSWDSRDRLLVVGDGTGDLARSDILTIYKDGRLNHAGSLSTVGEISTLSNFKYALPRPRRYQLPAAAFDPWRSDTEYIRGDGYIQYPLGGSTTSGTFKAPVQLPDGATVSKLSIYYYDDFENPGGGGSSVYITNLQADLRRMGTGLDAVASELVAATFSAGTLGAPETPVKYALETTSILLPTIDNPTYQYWLEVDFSVNTPSSSLRFYGATIEYTQDTVAP